MEFTYKVVSSMEKVFADAADVTALESKTLMGLQGETVSFQIACKWGEPRKAHGTVTVTSAAGEHIHVREVKLVPCEYPCHLKRDDGYLKTQPGLYPDLLREIKWVGYDLVPGQWRSLWVDFAIPQDMAAGVYPIHITLNQDKEILAEVDMAVEVLNLRLPKLNVPHTEWFYCDCLADWYHVEMFSEAHWAIIENYVWYAVKHKCNTLLTPVFTPPLDTGVGLERPTCQLVDVTVRPDGSYGFGFSKFHRWVHMAKSCGMEYFEISHLFTQWGAYHAPKVMGWKDGKYQQLFGWETDAAGEEYAAFLHQFLTALKVELEALGIGPKTYFHISDEPGMDHLESYRKALGVVQADLEGYQILDALSDYGFYHQGLVKQPVCSIDHIAPFLIPEQRPEKLWAYYCTAQCVNVTNRFIALPGARCRILGAQMYKYRLDGFLHWGWNFYNSEYSYFPINPYCCTDSCCANPAGDPFLVYPGENGQPVGSIRLMLMDEAMADLCAMNALEALAGREAVMACIEADSLVEIEQYPQDSAALEDMRRRINLRIKQALEA